MPDKPEETNKVFLTGKINSAFGYSHKISGEAFYKTILMVKRLSGNKDFIPVILSEKAIDVTEDYTGQFISIHGQFRSHNYYKDGRSHLELYVFAQDIQFVEEKDAIYENKIYLNGCLCKPPIYRLTPLNREIADFLLAVNRTHEKSDYIPGICWWKNATEIASYPVGKHIALSGRIQSREYTKKDADGNAVNKIAYEVSIQKLLRN